MDLFISFSPALRAGLCLNSSFTGDFTDDIKLGKGREKNMIAMETHLPLSLYAPGI